MDGASATDLFVDFQKLSTQSAEALKGLHFALRLLQGGGGSKGLGDRLALHFTGEAQVGPMRRLAGLVTAAIGFTATTPSGGMEPLRKSPRATICDKMTDLCCSRSRRESGKVHLLS